MLSVSALPLPKADENVLPQILHATAQTLPLASTLRQDEEYRDRKYKNKLTAPPFQAVAAMPRIFHDLIPIGSGVVSVALNGAKERA